MWPTLLPGSVNRKYQSSWYSLSCGDKALHTAFMFGSFAHQRALRLSKSYGSFTSAAQNMLKILEANAISNVNNAIQDPDRATSDATILSVVCLANNKLDDSIWQRSVFSPFQAPLRRLQWLDIYGRLLPNPVHQAGLAQIIAVKGGLKKIQLPGLASVISL